MTLSPAPNSTEAGLLLGPVTSKKRSCTSHRRYMFCLEFGGPLVHPYTYQFGQLTVRHRHDMFRQPSSTLLQTNGVVTPQKVDKPASFFVRGITKTLDR